MVTWWQGCALLCLAPGGRCPFRPVRALAYVWICLLQISVKILLLIKVFTFCLKYVQKVERYAHRNFLFYLIPFLHVEKSDIWWTVQDFIYFFFKFDLLVTLICNICGRNKMQGFIVIKLHLQLKKKKLILMKYKYLSKLAYCMTTGLCCLQPRIVVVLLMGGGDTFCKLANPHHPRKKKKEKLLLSLLNQTGNALKPSCCCSCFSCRGTPEAGS